MISLLLIRSRLLRLTTPHQHHSCVLTVAAKVGWLLPFSFQFCTRLAAVFAEEVGGFGTVVSVGLNLAVSFCQ